MEIRYRLGTLKPFEGRRPDWGELDVHMFEVTGETSWLLRSKAPQDVVKWCEEQFGERHDGTMFRWSEGGNDAIYFRFDDDAFAFRMRWC